MSDPVFVFGSNLAGRHGKGAALWARQHRGAIYGQGVGHQGNSYAIPTKNEDLRTLSLDAIWGHVTGFLMFARDRPDMRFQLTPIGCGLAGYTPAQIAPLFRGAPENVALPQEFAEILSSEARPLGSEPPCDEGNLPPAEQITQPSHDDEGLWLALAVAASPVSNASNAELINLCDQAANTISRLKGELEEARDAADDAQVSADTWLAEHKMSQSRSLQLEAEIKDLREAWDWLTTRTNLELDWAEIDEGEAAWRIHRISGNRSDREWELIATGETPLEAVRKARSLLSPSQDVGLSSARSSRDARSSTRPEGPRSDEGGAA